MMELSFGFGPGRQGGRVKAMEVFLQVKSVEVENVTLERPFSMSKLVRWDIFVRFGAGPLRKDSMVGVVGGYRIGWFLTYENCCTWF